MKIPIAIQSDRDKSSLNQVLSILSISSKHIYYSIGNSR